MPWCALHPRPTLDLLEMWTQRLLKIKQDLYPLSPLLSPHLCQIDRELVRIPSQPGLLESD